MSVDLLNQLLTRELLIEQLFVIGAIQEGEFILKTGISSPIYIDLRRIISYPEIFQYVVDLMWQNIAHKEFDHLGGVPYAALPLASGMALLYQRPMIMARKDVKDHGTKRSIEGVYKRGDTVMIIEDIVTSGLSIFETVDQMAREGLLVNDVVVFLDREQGAKEQLAQKGITLHAVCTLSQVLEILQQRGQIDESAARKIRDFIKSSQFQ
jgi:uridine monophosphate synthetase